MAQALIHYAGTAGLYDTIVGVAVMLLMPDRSGHALGGTLAVLGGIAMGYEIVLTRMV